MIKQKPARPLTRRKDSKQDRINGTENWVTSDNRSNIGVLLRNESEKRDQRAEKKTGFPRLDALKRADPKHGDRKMKID